MKNFLLEFLKVYPHIPSQALWRAIEAKLLYSLPLKQPVLDLGCGDGFFIKILFEDRSSEIFGCDIAKASLTIAKSGGIYKSICLSEESRLPYKDESFATVISNCVLEHIPEERNLLMDVSRVLKRGGTFVFTVPSENFLNNLRSNDKKYVENLNKRLEHFHYRSPQRWQNILLEYGLTLEATRYYLPKQVQQVWERMTQILLMKILGKELVTILGSSKTGLIFLLRPIIPVLFSKFLRKMYFMGDNDNGEGGGLLISACKNG